MRSHLRDPYTITITVAASPHRAETAITVSIADSNGDTQIMDVWAPVSDSQLPRFIAEVTSVLMRLGALPAAAWLEERRIKRF